MRMGLLTLLVPLVIVSILYYFNTTEFMIPVIIGKMSLLFQIGIGVAGGFVLSGMTWLMGQWKYLDDVNFDYTLRLGIFNFSVQEILFLSFCFFRPLYLQSWLWLPTYINLDYHLALDRLEPHIFGIVELLLKTLLCR